MLTKDDIGWMRHQGCTDGQFFRLLDIAEAAVVVVQNWAPFTDDGGRVVTPPPTILALRVACEALEHEGDDGALAPGPEAQEESSN